MQRSKSMFRYITVLKKLVKKRQSSCISIMFKSHVSGIVTHLPRLFLLHFVAFGLYQYTNFLVMLRVFCLHFLKKKKKKVLNWNFTRNRKMETQSLALNIRSYESLIGRFWQCSSCITIMMKTSLYCDKIVFCDWQEVMLPCIAPHVY